MVHRRPVAWLSIFYRYYFSFYSSELATAIHLTVPFYRSSSIEAANHHCRVYVARCRTSLFQFSSPPHTSNLWNTPTFCIFPTRTTFHFSRAGSINWMLRKWPSPFLPLQYFSDHGVYPLTALHFMRNNKEREGTEMRIRSRV